MRIQLVLIACLFVVASTSSSLEQASQVSENADSLEQAYVRALSKLTHPKLEERKRLVRGYQQRGYTCTLLNVLERNGTSAILSYLKTRLQIELSLPHEPIMVNISALPEAPPPISNSSNFLPRNKFSIILPSKPNEQVRIGLDIDWSFPADPWSGE